MSVFQRLFRRAQNPNADIQFSRFLRLNYRRYARLCITGSDSEQDTSTDIAGACREWLPSLSKTIHRDICASIAAYHESASKRHASLDELMTALDRLPAESPDEHAELILAATSRLSPSRTVQIKRYADRPVVDVTAIDVDQDLCAYCGTAPGNPAAFLFGPNIAVCGSTSCVSKHDTMLRAEATEIRHARPVSRYQH